MENLQRYLAEEVAEDHATGLLSRREALRRLGLMGFTAVGASALLAACGGDDDVDTGAQAPSSTAAGPSPSSTAPPATGASAARTEAITYAGRSGTLGGAYARAAGTPKGAVLVFHENRGLTDHIRSVAARLAGDGYSALAVDLLSAEGGSAEVGEANAGAALQAAGEQRLVGDSRASLDELARRQPGAKLGVIGFCFGGTLAWSLLDSDETRVAAYAPFYGTVSDNVDFAGSKAAVLGVYAERDERVNRTRQRATTALELARLPHEIRTFPGVDHAFFNDTGPRYDATQATDAYRAVLTWFGRHLGA